MHKFIPLLYKIIAVILLSMPLLSVSDNYRLVAAVIELALLALGSFSWPWLCKNLKFRPSWMVDLNGERAVEIKSQWRKHPDDPLLDPIPATLKIRQNWLYLSVTLITDKMKSKSEGELPIYDSKNRELTIKYFYTTDPKQEHSSENPPQNGCAFLKIPVDDPDSLTIKYTNDRGLGGDIYMTKRPS
ncbi:MAG: hypothetical protein MRY32_09230 [Rickettsiales bacterium]|nr:hypothetical protein [Rickettsiales bacterium]